MTTMELRNKLQKEINELDRTLKLINQDHMYYDTLLEKRKQVQREFLEALKKGI